jgi:Zn-dependent protease/CBS domain-containing protein
MKWSWKVGTLAGIDLRIHATFLLLLGWVAMSHWLVDKSFKSIVFGISFILALFGCILLHELGHALAARRYGIPTRDITLLPIGGLARLERMPEHPRQELWVALAGPAVNVAIAAMLYLWLTATHSWAPLGQLSVAGGPFMERLLVANVGLVLFNLVPAFPMDGGRVLRALLASRLEYARATQIAAGVGQAMALVFGFVGLFTNPMLVFVALFVWIGATQEVGAAQMRSAFSGTAVREAMITDFRELGPSDTLADSVRLILQGSQQDFPVVDQRKVLGVLTRSDLLTALASHGKDHPVAAIMKRDFQVAGPAEMLDTVFQRLEQCQCHIVPVVHQDRLVGLVTMENLAEYLLIQAAIRSESPRAGLAELAAGEWSRTLAGQPTTSAG